MEANRVLKAIRTGAFREAFLQNILSHSRLFFSRNDAQFCPSAATDRKPVKEGRD